MGDGPLNKGVIQLLYAGTDGSHEPSRDQERWRNATTWSRRRRQEAKMGVGQDGTGAGLRSGLEEGYLRRARGRSGPWRGGADQEERERRPT